MTTYYIIKIDPNHPKFKELEHAVDDIWTDGSRVIEAHDLKGEGAFLSCVRSRWDRRILIPADAVISVVERFQT